MKQTNEEMNEKIQYEEINQAISSIEKDNVEKSHQMLQDGKKLLLKQQKSIPIADREKDGQEVVKCHLFDDLAADLDD